MVYLFYFLKNYNYIYPYLKIINNMISLQINLDSLKIDYPDFYDFFKFALKNSNSKFKNYNENKYKCYYYISFYINSKQKTNEYYDNLYNMLFDDRLKEELSKTRVTITMTSGKFLLSDQTDILTDYIKNIVKEITAWKMYSEQIDKEIPDLKIINSIPNKDELEKKLKEIKNIQKNIIEMMGLDIDVDINIDEKLEPNKILKKLISEEKYEEANKLLNIYPELKNKNK